MQPRRSSLIVFLAIAVFGTSARAHGWHDGAGSGFAAGFAHPFGGIDHLLAMLAVGLWSASSGPRPWLAPLSFAAALIAGALASGTGLVPAVLQQGTEPVIAASVLVLGLLVALTIRLAAPAAAALVGAFAFFHGAAHGVELGTAAASLAGLAAATALLHGGGMVLGFALRGAHRRWLALVGSGISLAGLALGAALLGTLA